MNKKLTIFIILCLSLITIGAFAQENGGWYERHDFSGYYLPTDSTMSTYGEKSESSIHIDGTTMRLLYGSGWISLKIDVRDETDNLIYYGGTFLNSNEYAYIIFDKANHMAFLKYDGVIYLELFGKPENYGKL